MKNVSYVIYFLISVAAAFFIWNTYFESKETEEKQNLIASQEFMEVSCYNWTKVEDGYAGIFIENGIDYFVILVSDGTLMIRSIRSIRSNRGEEEILQIPLEIAKELFKAIETKKYCSKT